MNDRRAKVRLFVITARDVPEAIIIRRGPSRWYHLVSWDMRRDRFQEGAWIKGRIYEEKCDLSPDGKLFVYSVHQGSRVGTKFTDCWTAVSRPPWLEALVVWPQGTTYGGGGRFSENRQLVLRGCGSNTHPDFPLRGIKIVEGAAELHQSSGEVTDADWSGRDHKGCVIFTRGGQLFRRENKEDHILADWTDLKPDPQPAPDWAGRRL